LEAIRHTTTNYAATPKQSFGIHDPPIPTTLIRVHNRRPNTPSIAQISKFPESERSNFVDNQKQHFPWREPILGVVVLSLALF